MRAGTRIDIIAGCSGAGKTSLIRQLMRSAPEKVGVADGRGWHGIVSGGPRPGRVLMEAPAGMGMGEAADLAMAERSLWPSFVGARVAVIDAARFGRGQDIAEVRMATHVYLNRASGLDCAGKAQILRQIWAANPRAGVLVEPLDGLNLWRLLDILPNDDLTDI